MVFKFNVRSLIVFSQMEKQIAIYKKQYLYFKYLIDRYSNYIKLNYSKLIGPYELKTALKLYHVYISNDTTKKLVELSEISEYSITELFKILVYLDYIDCNYDLRTVEGKKWSLMTN